jgi:hypothetical protein
MITTMISIVLAFLQAVFAISGVRAAPQNCQIQGRITLKNSGQAVAQLPIGLVYTAYTPDGRPTLELLESSKSGENGEYALNGPLRGLQHIVTGTVSGDQKIYLSVEVPVTSTSCEGGIRADIAVASGEPVTIRGELIDGLGHRYPHIDWVWLEPYGPSISSGIIPPSALKNLGWQNGWRNQSQFRIENIPPGKYTIHDMRFDEISHRAETVIPIEVRDHNLKVDLVSEGSYALSGHIMFDGPRFLFSGRDLAYVAVRPLQVKPVATIPAATVNPDGSFGFESIPAGTYALSFEDIPDPFYLKSLRRGTVDLLQNGIVVPASSSESLTVIISGDGGRLSGSVTGVTSEDAATIVLVPKDRPVRTDLYRVKKTDATGFFEMRGVAPGNYEVYAWKPEEIARRDYFDPDFLKMFQGRGTAVRIGSYSDIRVELDLLHN